MASVIFHGDPGSYKTASAVWFEMLPALRSGRCVVTNIEGLFDLETIQKELGETFPDEAQLWRISTLNKTGENLMARWFHWLPAGALLLIDEVQNIYSDKDRKELTDFNVALPGQPDTVDIISANDLPEALRDYSISVVDDIKDDGYTDDLGLTERDNNGHIRYPLNIKDALMRHRKFNWDILVCTPDITKVHNLIRSVAEVAASHKSFDSVPLPYFQRRPRIHEHNSLERGLSPKKGELVKRRKVPIDVHKLYKSTQTGKNNKSGKGASPFKSGVFRFYLVLFLSCLAYLFYYAFFDGDSSTSAVAGQVVSETGESVQVSVGQNSVASRSSVSPDSGNDSVSVVDEVPDVEPLIGYQFYVTGFTKQIKYSREGRTITPDDFTYHIYFDVYKGGQFLFKTTNTDLNDMGYITKTLAECVYKLSYNESYRIVTCKEDDDTRQESQRDDTPVDLDNSLLVSAPTNIL